MYNIKLIPKGHVSRVDSAYVHSWLNMQGVFVCLKRIVWWF